MVAKARIDHYLKTKYHLNVLNMIDIVFSAHLNPSTKVVGLTKVKILLQGNITKS